MRAVIISAAAPLATFINIFMAPSIRGGFGRDLAVPMIADGRCALQTRRWATFILPDFGMRVYMPIGQLDITPRSRRAIFIRRLTISLGFSRIFEELPSSRPMPIIWAWFPQRNFNGRRI